MGYWRTRRQVIWTSIVPSKYKILKLIDTTKTWIRSSLIGKNNIVLCQADGNLGEYMGKGDPI